MTESDHELKRQVERELRKTRERAREESTRSGELEPYPEAEGARPPLGPIPMPKSPPAPVSPDRSFLNEGWDVATALDTPPTGWLGRMLSFLRKPAQRAIRFALGPLVERQAEMNSAQVKFDNQLIEYIDARLDRVSAHYDGVLGLYGKRMEEIDERHLILQQELIQHVHDLIRRIDFVFETAEQNHLYLEAFLREVRDETRALAARLDPSCGPSKETQ